MVSPRSAALYPIQVLVAFDSPSPTMSTIAERVAEGARTIGGVETRLLPVDDHFLATRTTSISGAGLPTPGGPIGGYSQLTQADAIIVGTQAPLGIDNSPVQRLFGEDYLATHGIRAQVNVFGNKVAAAFPSVAGVSHPALVSLTTRLMDLGMILVTPSQRLQMYEAASTLTEAAQESARRFGRRVAEVTLWMKMGQAHQYRNRRVPSDP